MTRIARSLVPLFVPALLLFGARPAFATPTTLIFPILVTDTDGGEQAFPGDTLVGSLRYDTSAADQNTLPNTALYALTDVRIRFPDGTDLELPIVALLEIELGSDTTFIHVQARDTNISTVNLTLALTGADRLNSLALPLDTAKLNGSRSIEDISVNYVISHTSFTYNGTVGVFVPEPTLALPAGGALAVALTRRRRIYEARRVEPLVD